MIDLELLGISKEELQDRVIDRIADEVLSSYETDEDGNDARATSQFRRKLDAEIMRRLDAAIVDIAGKHVLPNTNAMIESVVLQKTNQWGEKVGEPVTFIEYLISRAVQYMHEDVNSEGKSRTENGSYSFTKVGTRLSVMIDRKISADINTAMTKAFSEANKALALSLMETMRTQLNSVVAKINVRT